MGFGTSAIYRTAGLVTKTAWVPRGTLARTVAATHATLHHNDLLALPRVQHGHSRNRTTGFERNRVDRVVRANDERHVCLAEVVINLVHLQHDCEERKKKQIVSWSLRGE